MAKQSIKQVRFVGEAAADCVAAFEKANSGFVRFPWTASAGELDLSVQALVFVNCPEQASSIPPDWLGHVVHWTATDDLPARMNRLLSRLTSGVDLPDPPPPPPAPVAQRVLKARVGREVAGRRGKGVTTVFDLTIPESELAELAQRLKQKCGSGGTVKDGKIEIQGEHRDKVVSELEKLGFQVKRAGG